MSQVSRSVTRGVLRSGRPEVPYTVPHSYGLYNEGGGFLRLFLGVSFWVTGVASSMLSLGTPLESWIKPLKGLWV